MLHLSSLIGLSVPGKKEVVIGYVHLSFFLILLLPHSIWCGVKRESYYMNTFHLFPTIIIIVSDLHPFPYRCVLIL